MITVYVAAEALLLLLPLGSRVLNQAVTAKARGCPILRTVKLFGSLRTAVTYPFAHFFQSLLSSWAKLVVFSFSLSRPVLGVLLSSLFPNLEAKVVIAELPPPGQPRHLAMLGIPLSDYFKTIVLDLPSAEWHPTCCASLHRVRHDMYVPDTPSSEQMDERNLLTAAANVQITVERVLQSRALLFACVAVRRVNELFASSPGTNVTACLDDCRHTLFYGTRFIEPAVKDHDVPWDFWFDLVAHGATVVRGRGDAPDEIIMPFVPDAEWVAQCIAALVRFPDGFCRDRSFLDHALIILATAPPHPLVLAPPYFSAIWEQCGMEEPGWARFVEAVAGSNISLEVSEDDVQAGRISCRLERSERMPWRRPRSRDVGTFAQLGFSFSIPQTSSASGVQGVRHPPLPDIPTGINLDVDPSAAKTIQPDVGKTVVKVEPDLPQVEGPPPRTVVAGDQPLSTVSSPLAAISARSSVTPASKSSDELAPVRPPSHQTAASQPSQGSNRCLLQLSQLGIKIQDKEIFLQRQRKDWSGYLGDGIMLGLEANNDIVVVFKDSARVDELMLRDPPLMLGPKRVPIVAFLDGAAETRDVTSGSSTRPPQKFNRDVPTVTPHISNNAHAGHVAMTPTVKIENANVPITAGPPPYLPVAGTVALANRGVSGMLPPPLTSAGNSHILKSVMNSSGPAPDTGKIMTGGTVKEESVLPAPKATALTAAAAFLPTSALLPTKREREQKERPSKGSDRCRLQLSALKIHIANRNQFLQRQRKVWESYIGHGIVKEFCANNDIIVVFKDADDVDALMTSDPPLCLGSKLVPIVPHFEADGESSTTSAGLSREVQEGIKFHRIEVPPSSAEQRRAAGSSGASMILLAPPPPPDVSIQRQLLLLTQEERQYLDTLVQGRVEACFADPEYFDTLKTYALESLNDPQFARNQALCLSIVKKLGPREERRGVGGGGPSVTTSSSYSSHRSSDSSYRRR